jgi:hypothetical protein
MYIDMMWVEPVFLQLWVETVFLWTGLVILWVEPIFQLMDSIF